MNSRLTMLIGFVAVALLAAGQAVADPHGGGGHPGGGGWGGGGGGGGWGSGHPSGGSGYGGSGGHDYSDHGSSAHPAARAPAHAYDHHYAGHYGWHGYGHPVYGWYHGDWYWHHPWHYCPFAWGIGVGFGLGLAWDAPWYWGYYPYYNPYYTEVIVVPGGAIDYSRPIVVAGPPAGMVAANQAATDAEVARLLDAARGAFTHGDYQLAMAEVNQAIARQPNDGILHEARALILFATKQYKPAAAAVYAVLSVGPGWDWATLCGFYPNPEVYTAQLRDLEQYRNAHPELPEVHFLAAYHYMTCNHPEAAMRELQAVVRLSPRDQLAGQLLTGLSSGDKSGTEPVPAPPGAVPPSLASLPVSAAALMGNWEASRPDGSTFAFTLSDASTYTWKYTRNGQTKEFTGTYSVAEGLLILKRNGNPAMIGQVTLPDANHFTFKLAADNPADPGLTFSRR